MCWGLSFQIVTTSILHSCKPYVGSRCELPSLPSLQNSPLLFSSLTFGKMDKNFMNSTLPDKNSIEKAEKEAHGNTQRRVLKPLDVNRNLSIPQRSTKNLMKRDVGAPRFEPFKGDSFTM